MDDGRSIRVRAAATSDAAAIASIYNQSVVASVATFDTVVRSLESQEAWLRHHDRRHPVLVAEGDGRVIGWASLSPWSDRPAYDDAAEISIYVDEQHQGRGVGRRLMASILGAARTERFHTVLLTSPQIG